MQAQFSGILKQPQQSRSSLYIDLLKRTFDEVLSKKADHSSLQTSIDSITQFVSNIVQDSIGLLISRSTLTELVKLIEDIKDNDRFELKKGLIQSILDEPNLSARTLRFEDLVTRLREALADILEEEQDWSEAAQVLKAIPLDGTHQAIPEEYKLKNYIRIVRLLLEDDDPTSAESYLNRAGLLIPITNDQTTILSFKLSQARIFDSRRKFEEASKKYHEISLTELDLAQEEREYCLSASMICAILAKAGPSRTRILRDLFRDSRCKDLSNFQILSKMFFDQIIKPHELVEFKRHLKPHHMAKLSNSFVILDDDEDEDEPMEEDNDNENGSSSKVRTVLKNGPETVLDRAIMQHNLLAASKIYNNISFRGLGNLVGLKPIAVEIMARTMIQENRLKATIDQVDGMITFEKILSRADDEVLISNVAVAIGEKDGSNGGSGVDRTKLIQIAPESIKWDESIRKTSQKVEAIYDHLISSNNTIL